MLPAYTLIHYCVGTHALILTHINDTHKILFTFVNMHTYLCTHSHSCMLTRAHIHTHTHTLSHTHTLTHLHTHTLTHTVTHIHTHSLTHLHPHTHTHSHRIPTLQRLPSPLTSSQTIVANHSPCPHRPHSPTL